MATREQIRCARCCMVVFDVFTEIMQDLMKKSTVPPADVYQKVMKTRGFRARLDLTEMHMIQTLTTDGFSQLDVSLIYKIVKYFKIFIPQPTRQWGSNPQPGEIEVGDDVERIRIARNILLNNTKAEVSIGGMNDFFTTFIDVGRRMDQHLNKPADSGFEQVVRNYRGLDLDVEIAEQNIQAQEEKESFKEKLAVKVERKEIHILVGRTMDEVINRVRQCEADSTIQVKFIIDGVDDPHQQVEMLNALQGEINTEGSNIQFVGSSVEGEISVIMASADDDSKIYNSPICSPVETDPRGFWIGSNSLVLNLEIKSEVFETSNTLQKYVTEFCGTLLKKTDGRQLIQQKDVNVILESGDQEKLPDVDEPENNYYRLVVLIVGTAGEVVRQYFKFKFLVNGETFQAFLDRNKHIILHLCKTDRCCQCSDTQKREKILTEEQIKALYKFDKSKRDSSHSKTRKQICICPYETEPTVDLDVLDLSLARAIILNCHSLVTLGLGVDVWLKTIIETRNYVFHKSDMRLITKDDFAYRWVGLAGAVEGLANFVSEKYYREVSQEIRELKKRVNVSISDDRLKHAVLSLAYWRYKCTELEESRLTHFHLCRKILKKDNYKLKSLHAESEDKLVEKIEVFNTFLDNVLIKVSGNAGETKLFESTEETNISGDARTVPVLFQLEVPYTWNRSDILDAVAHMQRNIIKNQACRIKSISVEDLSILVEILRNVFNTKEKLQEEVHEIMTEIITEAGVDTREMADFNVNMTVYDDEQAGVDTKDDADLNVAMKITENTQDFQQIRPREKCFYQLSTFRIQDLLGNGYLVAALLLEDSRLIVIIKTMMTDTIYTMHLLDDKASLLRSQSLDHAVVDRVGNLVQYDSASVAVLEYCHDRSKCVSVYDVAKFKKMTELPLNMLGESKSYRMHIVDSLFITLFGSQQVRFINQSGQRIKMVALHEKCSELFFATLEHLFLTGLHACANQLFCFNHSGVKLYTIDFTISFSCINGREVVDNSLYINDGDYVYHISSEGKKTVVLGLERLTNLSDMSYSQHTRRLLLSHDDGHVSIYTVQTDNDSDQRDTG